MADVKQEQKQPVQKIDPKKANIQAQPGQPVEGGKKSKWWLWVLIILVIAAALYFFVL